MKKINKINVKKEFLENRTSWGFYLKIINGKDDFNEKKPTIETYLLLEILKELQFMNDKKLSDKTLKKHVYSLAGKAVSEKKSEAARENGKKGGRPKKIKEEREDWQYF